MFRYRVTFFVSVLALLHVLLPFKCVLSLPIDSGSLLCMTGVAICPAVVRAGPPCHVCQPYFCARGCADCPSFVAPAAITVCTAVKRAVCETSHRTEVEGLKLICCIRFALMFARKPSLIHGLLANYFPDCVLTRDQLGSGHLQGANSSSVALIAGSFMPCCAP